MSDMRFVLEDFEGKNILGYLAVSDQVFFITNICNYIFSIVKKCLLNTPAKEGLLMSH